MAVSAEIIRQRLLAAFPGAAIEVRDTTGAGDHYAATVVSELFAGKPLLQRHRLVYAALAEAMQSEIHALALSTLTPAERAKAPGTPA